MSTPEERRREYPGERFAQSVIQQDLVKLSRELKQEDLGSGHGERGHNQIELYRHKGTTVSLFYFEQGGHIPDHLVEDGSVIIQVLEGTICFQTKDAETHIHPASENLVILEPGIKHSIQAETESRVLLTIIR